MGDYDASDHDTSGYDDAYTDRRFRHRDFPHSKLGIASFVIGGLVIVWDVGLMLIVGLVATAGSYRDPEEWLMQRVGFGCLVGLPAAIVGIVLGGVAVTLPRQKKLFGFLGIAANFLVLVGMCGLLVIGLAAGG